jgi:PAS domain S-box-containing protein
MKNVRFSIRNKIIYGFLTLIIIFSGYAVYTVITVKQGNDIIQKSLNVVNPTVDAITEFMSLVNQSKMLITNWVYLQANEADKQALEALHKTGYPEARERLNRLEFYLSANEELPPVDTIFIQFEQILDTERMIMSSLQKFEDYEDPIKKFTSEEAIESQIIPKTSQLMATLQHFVDVINVQKSETDKEMLKNNVQLETMTYVLGLLLLIIGVVMAVYLSGSITKPIKYIRGVIDKVGKGEMVPVDRSKVTNDEIGDMAESVAKMASGFSAISEFAENIGNGKYDSDFKPLSDKDMLGNALIEMRDNLKKVAVEDKRRNWATSGLATFGEILRNYSDDFSKLTDEIISKLVKYMEANQGALLIASNTATDGDEEPYMEMAACYAWDKKKFVEKKVYKGDGLAGQAWIEGDTIYLTEVPDSYITITSGLGAANPRSIVIVPLKVNEDIHGVIELASFREYDAFEIEFIEKVSESIAATISSVKVNERTQRLLEESTVMTEQMRAQEEEMRQNMEELQATQEKIQRDQTDHEAREKIYLYNTAVLEMDRRFIIGKINDFSKKVLGYESSELEGRSLKDLLQKPGDLNIIQEQASEKTSWEGVLRVRHRNGKWVDLLVSVGQVPDSLHNDLMYVVYCRNISKLAVKANSN